MKTKFSMPSIKPAAICITGVALIGVSACTTYQPSYAPTINRNPIEISESIERLELYTGEQGLSLSARDRDAVAMFVQSFARSGNGPLYVNVPSNSGSSQGAAQAKALIREDLARFGLSGAPVQTGQYQAEIGAPAPVVVSFRQLKTVAQDCRYMESLTLTSNNQPSSTFGCSQSSNLAMMIHDPRQLLEPYAISEPNSARRMTVYDKYIKGENTASAQPARQEISSDEN